MLYNSGHSKELQILMRELCLYISEFKLLNEDNLYTHFLVKLKHKLGDIKFSSLNYDLLFEDALENLELWADYFGTDPQKVDYMKLHGSCNFLPKEENNVTFNNCYMERSNAFEYPLYGAHRKKVVEFCNIKDNIYPAIALYMDSKPKQLAAKRLGDILERWQRHILEANKILIIGVRPNINDTHIWNPLRDTNAKIGFIGSDDFKNWQKKNRSNKDNFIGTKWEEHFSESVEFLNTD